MVKSWRCVLFTRNLFFQIRESSPPWFVKKQNLLVLNFKMLPWLMVLEKHWSLWHKNDPMKSKQIAGVKFKMFPWLTVLGKHWSLLLKNDLNLHKWPCVVSAWYWSKGTLSLQGRMVAVSQVWRWCSPASYLRWAMVFVILYNCQPFCELLLWPAFYCIRIILSSCDPNCELWK